MQHTHRESENSYARMTDGQSPAPAPGVAIPSLRTTRRGVRPTPVRNQTRPTAHAEALVTPTCIMLILEDFDEIRAFLSRHFTQQGYDVFSSATLRDAIAIAWEEAPHIIIVDYD